MNQSERSITDNNNTEGEHKNNKPNGFEKYGTWSDIAQVIATVIAIGFTIALFYQTKEATQHAGEAVEEAKKANEETRRNDRRNRIYQVKKDVEDKKESDRIYELNKRATDSSIALSKATLQHK